MRRSLLMGILGMLLPMFAASSARGGTPPTNGLIAFGSVPQVNQDVSPLKTIDPGTLTTATVLPRRFNTDPDYTDDGSMLALARGSFRRLSIFAQNGDGTGLRRLTDGKRSVFDSSPSWSPDASRIVFQRCRNVCKLMLMNADGSALTRLTSSGDSTSERSPSWGPDDRIVYVHDGPSSNGIATIDPDGSDRILLTDRAFDFDPSWSPDGDRLAFVRFLIADGSHGLFLMDDDGTNVTRLTDGEPADFSPSFSPDGQLVTFTRANQHSDDLWTIEVDGDDPTRLTDSLRNESSPAWQVELP